MTKRTSKVDFLALAAITMAVSLTGCGFLQPRKDLTIEDKEKVVHDTAATAIAIALLEGYKDPKDQVKAAKELKTEIDKNVLNGVLLDPNGTIDESTEKLLFAKIPPKYAFYLQSALSFFRLYYTTPKPGELLGPENWRLLVALFKGVSDGCQTVINMNPEVSLGPSIHRAACRLAA